MKQIKTLVALVLALMLMMSVASAATIDVKSVVDGETYTAYKILNYTDNGKTGTDRAVSYYLTAAEYGAIGSVLKTAGFAFTASAGGTQYFVNNAATIDVAAVAAYLGEHVADLGDALGKATATGASGSASFTNLATGYYFVTSSVGSLCALHEETDIATVVEKNTIPTIDKKESKTESDYVDGLIDENIGDTIYYQIVVTDGIGTNAELTVTDTMSTGLTYNAGTLKINNAAVEDDANVADQYKVTVNGQEIKVVFAPAYVANLAADATITITFNATINENAVIDSATGNENKVELDYSNQHSDDKVYVATYDFQLKKTDGTTFLPGAGFKLYDAETNGNQILLSKDGTGYYKDTAGDAATEIEVDSANGVNVRGLEPGTYYLEETTVPDGYNKLSSRTKVEITTGATAPVQITVVNEKGTELPSTGGIGTTIFYIAGAVLVLGAAAIVIARRKAEQD